MASPPNSERPMFKDVKFTVHNFTRNVPISESSASETALLNVAYGIIGSSKSTSKSWGNGTSRSNSKPRSLDLSGKLNSYTFGRDPPQIPGSRKRDIKEWGTAVTDDEIFHLEDLEEFTSTDFTRATPIVPTPSPSTKAPTDKRGREIDTKTTPELPPKRRKIVIGSIFRVIPRPHIHPSPFSDKEVPLKGRPYVKAQPIYIPPYTSFSCPEATRVAWIIPIRGRPPWEGCTTSVLLDDVDIDSGEPTAQEQIVWTQASLLQFWDFLLGLRKSGALGPLGVAFHASLRKKQYLETTNLQETQPSTSRSRLITPPTTATATVTAPTLSESDHIKVYHDAHRRLHVRHALDIWFLEVEGAMGQKRKIRPLKNAHLVLVDDRSRGIQIS